MYKWMFDRYVEEYKKEPFENVVGRLMAVENIECSDRAFANQCEAGTTIYTLNEFFTKIEELCNATPEDNIPVLINEVKKYFENAKCSYQYIRYGIREINDNFRCGKEERKVLENIKNAKSGDDEI